MQNAGQKRFASPPSPPSPPASGPFSPTGTDTHTSFKSTASDRSSVPESHLPQLQHAENLRYAAARQCFASQNVRNKPLPEHIFGSSKRSSDQAFPAPLTERFNYANQTPENTQANKCFRSATRVNASGSLPSTIVLSRTAELTMPDIFLAAKDGNKAVLAHYLHHTANIDALDKNGKTLIMIAAAGGHTDVVIFLITRRANLKQTDQRGNTLLAIAAKHGKQEMVSLLLGIGIKLDKKNHAGSSAVMLAAENGHTSVVDFLIQHNANFNDVNRAHETALMLAAKNGHLSVVKTLVAEGAHIKAADSEGHTAIALATEEGHEDVVAFLAPLLAPL